MTRTKIGLTCVVLAMGICAALYLRGPRRSSIVQSTPATQALQGDLLIEDLQLGTGVSAIAGSQISIHYKAWLKGSEQPFDSSFDRHQPYAFKLGLGQAIQGWDLGIVGMKVGGKRKLTVPPRLAYGVKGAGGIVPPDATLIYEIELLEVR